MTEPADKRSSGTMIALVRGHSSRRVLRNTVRNLAQIPRFLVSRLSRRDPKLWVFGNLHGFRDSPRYLAEHLVHEQPDLRAHWIAHTADEAGAARAAGVEAVLIGTPEAKRIQRRAGVAFFTHGFRDLDLPLVGGAYLVYLWHGVPFKRVGLDLNVAQARRRPPPVKVAARIVRWATFRAYRLVHLYVASGELDKERFLTAFGTSPERVKPLGSPRFDVIRGTQAYRWVMPRDLRGELGYAPEDRIVLWVPTHRREYGDDAWLPTLTPDDLAALDASNVKLLVKTHPRADWDVYRERLPDHPRVRLLHESDVDVNCLLNIADALVTDYSSVVFDYAVLGRPVHFFAPDVERYTADRGLYDPYDTLTKGMHHTAWAALLGALAQGARAGAGGEGMLLWKRVADYVGNNTEPETCRRIAEAIVSRRSGPTRS
ncbi:MAG: CDP-glycerol glycerophosphotransferase family protein [Chloroflexota bacterium]